MRQHQSPAPSPGKPQRSKPKFISGIMLTVMGAIFIPSVITVINNALASGQDTGYVVGSVFGALILPVVLLSIGITLILKSRPKR
ncbi:MAG: hypothetical protein QM705_11580 [Ancrocorticia sp.]